MAQESPQAQTLYILGDFFEYWIGDDVMDDFHQLIADRLRALTEAGVALFFMPGNRDFLIGNTFCQQIGGTLLSDPTLITLGSEPVLLMHGDSLCTRDTDYMRFRRVVRNPLIQRLFLALPKRFRRNIAQKLRHNSRTSARQKPMMLMDVTDTAVTESLLSHRVKTLIHGHTHRAYMHELPNQCQRIVLGDWDKLGWYLRHDRHGFELVNFPIHR